MHGGDSGRCHTEHVLMAEAANEDAKGDDSETAGERRHSLVDLFRGSRIGGVPFITGRALKRNRQHRLILGPHERWRKRLDCPRKDARGEEYKGDADSRGKVAPEQLGTTRRRRIGDCSC